MDIADETVTAARRHHNPYWIAYALAAFGQAFARTDPTRALTAWREGLEYARTHRIPVFEAIIASEMAGLEAVRGDPERALDLFDFALDSFLQAGNVVHIVAMFAGLAVLFDRADRPDVAATLYGATTRQPAAVTDGADHLPAAVDHLRAVLGETLFDRCAATGAGMDLGDAVAYARHNIHTARAELNTSS